MTLLKDIIRTIPDYPKPGIQFRDIMPLLADPGAFDFIVGDLADRARRLEQPFQFVAGLEARGFLFGAALAWELGVGFVPLRKPGKLPGDVLAQDYELEYGTDQLEIQKDILPQGAGVLLFDDLIATGGTAEAGIKLIRQAGADVVASYFVVDLPDLGGADKIRGMGLPVEFLVQFEGE